MNQQFIERAEVARDLKAQLAGLAQEDESGIQFSEWSPGRTYVTIWNMETGEEVTLPRYQAVAAVNTPSPRGGWTWTGKPGVAPAPRVNSVKCFLHPESAERAFLDENGIGGVCMSEHLASEGSKWQHARNRHKSAFAQYEEAKNRQERREQAEKDEARTQAILKLAEKSSK